MARQKNFYGVNHWKVKCFHTVLFPIYYLFKLFFKRSLVMITVPLIDDIDGDGAKRDYRGMHDYIRLRTMDLIADVTKKNLANHDYSIAEIGVFRGDFAAQIQHCFPDKQFYLFDTFCGFPSNDKKMDIDMGLSSDVYQYGDLTDTSIKIVREKLPNPDNCHFCVGYFPDSITPLHRNISWGFVSLDVDLYKPTIDALRFFYPALIPGGAIMIHDYLNPSYKGVMKAVEDFEKEGTLLAKLPVSDICSSLVILKVK